MKFFALLVISVLAPALPQADALHFPAGIEHTDFRYGNGYSGKPWAPDRYLEFGYGAAPRSLEQDAESTRREGRLWVPAPPLSSEDPKLGPYNADSYPFARPRTSVPGLYEQFRPPSSYYGNERIGQQSVRGIDPRQDVVVRQGRYRFRGDDDSGKDSRNGEIWHEGYRFRPLTAQEREHVGIRPGWRPLEDERSRRPSVSPNLPAPGMDESYGYQADDWFSLHFR